jgi:hypothetical protein
MRDGDIDIINYQVRDIAKEAIEKTSCKQEEWHQQVQTHITTLQ